MFVKYFIPEDGDDQAHPNVFRIDSAQPSFAAIKNAFPVPGSYHFRFLKNIGSHIVWLDITDESAALPTHQGSIFIKVSRIATPVQSTATPAATHQFIATASFEPTPAFVATTAEPVTQLSPPVKAPKPAVDRRNSEKLLKFDDDVTSPVSSAPAADIFAPSSVPITASATLASDDLLGIGSNSSDSNTHKAPAASTDFFGLDTLKPVSNVMGGSSNGSRSISPMAMGMGGGPTSGPMGGMGTRPMSSGSVGNGMNNMGMQQGMHAPSPMGGPGMNPMGGRGGMGMGMGPPPGNAAPPRPPGPGAPNYDPFNSIGGLSGMPNRGAGAGTGMNNGRR